MGRLTRKVGIVALGRGANALAVYAVYALAARTWDKVQCEVFAAVWVLSNALVPIFLIGLPTAVLYFFPRRENTRGLALQAGSCALSSAIILGGLLHLAGSELFAILHGDEGPPPGMNEPLAAFIPYAVALVAGGVLDAVLIAAERAHWQALLGLGSSVGLVAAAAVGYAWGLTTAEVLGLISCVGLLRLAAAYVLVYRVVGSGAHWGADGWRELLSYTRPIAMNDAVGALSRTVDRIVILYFFTHETFAEYHFGAVEVPISLLLAAVVTVLVPEVSALYQRGDRQAIAHLWRQAVSRLALIALPLFCFLFAFADVFIAWYLPAEYAASTWVFRIFLLSLPLRCAVYNPLLVGMGKASWALWGSLFDLAFNAALSVGLVLWLTQSGSAWAYLGPAIATVVATYAQVAFLVGAIAIHLRWTWSELLPWSGLVRLALIGLVASGASRWVSQWLELGAMMQLCLGGTLCALATLALLGADPHHRHALRSLISALYSSKAAR